MVPSRGCKLVPSYDQREAIMTRCPHWVAAAGVRVALKHGVTGVSQTTQEDEGRGLQPQSLIRFKKHGAREGKQAEEADLAVCAKGPPRLAKITPPLVEALCPVWSHPGGEGSRVDGVPACACGYRYPRMSGIPCSVAPHGHSLLRGTHPPAIWS